jgi:ATPase subunit of ABC transporter with duplicated ATPase domains
MIKEAIQTASSYMLGNMIVSHDRNFLDAIAEETIDFQNQKLTYHAGNYHGGEVEEKGKAETGLSHFLSIIYTDNILYLQEAQENKAKTNYNECSKDQLLYFKQFYYITKNLIWIHSLNSNMPTVMLFSCYSPKVWL